MTTCRQAPAMRGEEPAAPVRTGLGSEAAYSGLRGKRTVAVVPDGP